MKFCMDLYNIWANICTVYSLQCTRRYFVVVNFIAILPTSELTPVKGTVSQDFRLLVFFMNQFPQAPEYTIKAVSIFFENLQRNLQLKVHHHRWHRWQMEKIFNHKSFYFVWLLLGSRVTYRNFSFKFTLRCKQSDICHRCRWYRRQFCRQCRWHRWANFPLVSWCSLTCEYLREFSKKIETVLMGYSGAGWETDS